MSKIFKNILTLTIIFSVLASVLTPTTVRGAQIVVKVNVKDDDGDAVTDTSLLQSIADSSIVYYKDGSSYNNGVRLYPDRNNNSRLVFRVDKPGNYLLTTTGNRSFLESTYELTISEDTEISVTYKEDEYENVSEWTVEIDQKYTEDYALFLVEFERGLQPHAGTYRGKYKFNVTKVPFVGNKATIGGINNSVTKDRTYAMYIGVKDYIGDYKLVSKMYSKYVLPDGRQRLDVLATVTEYGNGKGALKVDYLSEINMYGLTALGTNVDQWFDTIMDKEDIGKSTVYFGDVTNPVTLEGTPNLSQGTQVEVWSVPKSVYEEDSDKIADKSHLVGTMTLGVEGLLSLTGGVTITTRSGKGNILYLSGNLSDNYPDYYYLKLPENEVSNTANLLTFTGASSVWGVNRVDVIPVLSDGEYDVTSVISADIRRKEYEDLRVEASYNGIRKPAEYLDELKGQDTCSLLLCGLTANETFGKLRNLLQDCTVEVSGFEATKKFGYNEEMSPATVGEPSEVETDFNEPEQVKQSSSYDTVRVWSPFYDKYEQLEKVNQDAQPEEKDAGSFEEISDNPDYEQQATGVGAEYLAKGVVLKDCPVADLTSPKVASYSKLANHSKNRVQKYVFNLVGDSLKEGEPIPASLNRKGTGAGKLTTRNSMSTAIPFIGYNGYVVTRRGEVTINKTRGPITPYEPAKPEDSKPGEPVKPEEPKPSEPVKPEEPKPSEPITPYKHTPSEPTTPYEPAPSKPTKPRNPGDPLYGINDEDNPFGNAHLDRKELPKTSGIPQSVMLIFGMFTVSLGLVIKKHRS